MFLPAITQQLDDACRRIASGRAAARVLTALVKEFDLKEAEFRLLWALQAGDDQRCQSQLAEYLGYSPAQVSDLVERQRTRGNIAGQDAAGDRRRQVWRITQQGHALLERIVAQVQAESPVPLLRVHDPRRYSA